MGINRVSFFLIFGVPFRVFFVRSPIQSIYFCPPNPAIFRREKSFSHIPVSSQAKYPNPHPGHFTEMKLVKTKVGLRQQFNTLILFQGLQIFIFLFRFLLLIFLRIKFSYLVQLVCERVGRGSPIRRWVPMWAGAFIL